MVGAGETVELVGGGYDELVSLEMHEKIVDRGYRVYSAGGASKYSMWTRSYGEIIERGLVAEGEVLERKAYVVFPFPEDGKSFNDPDKVMKSAGEHLYLGMNVRGRQVGFSRIELMDDKVVVGIKPNSFLFEYGEIIGALDSLDVGLYAREK